MGSSVLPKRLKELREQAGRTQVQLATKAEVSKIPSRIRSWIAFSGLPRCSG